MATKPATTKRPKGGDRPASKPKTPGLGFMSQVRGRLMMSMAISASLPVLALATAFWFQSGGSQVPSNGMLLATSVVATGALLGSLFLGVFISRVITRQVDALSYVVDQLRAGNLRARVDVLNTDELGALGTALNGLLDELGDLIQSRDDRHRTEEAIKQLMSEVSEVASGNLTIEAQVGEGVTGGIADAVNFMVVELRSLISNVMDSTTEVSRGAKEISGSAVAMAQGSEDQATRIQKAATDITEMANSVRKVASDAEALAERASAAIQTAHKGNGAVQNTIQGMGRIRENAQETALRIKRLGEGSQEIGEIVRLIGDIADRTSTLALNASIQSAAAGEAGRGFAVVAEEVERLAVRSAEATRQIDGLIRRIQNETKEAVTAVEESTREIVDGSRLANQAGETLTQIEGVSQEIGVLLRGMANDARDQANHSESIVQTVGELSTISQETAEQTRGTADVVQSLAEHSDKLRESVSTFQLPN